MLKFVIAAENEQFKGVAVHIVPMPTQEMYACVYNWGTQEPDALNNLYGTPLYLL